MAATVLKSQKHQQFSQFIGGKKEKGAFPAACAFQWNNKQLI